MARNSDFFTLKSIARGRLITDQKSACSGLAKLSKDMLDARRLHQKSKQLDCRSCIYLYGISVLYDPKTGFSERRNADYVRETT